MVGLRNRRWCSDPSENWEPLSKIPARERPCFPKLTSLGNRFSGVQIQFQTLKSYQKSRQGESQHLIVSLGNRLLGRLRSV